MNRRTAQVKLNCMGVFAGLIHVEAIRSHLEWHLRIYKSDLGTRNILALEIDFEDLVGLASFWRQDCRLYELTSAS